MKKELNWKDLGRFFSVLLNLFTIIRDTFTAQGIGLEIVGWVTGEGKDAFVEKFLKPLGEQFLATARVVVVDENTIRVNLDAPLVLPFEGAVAEASTGSGWVTVQKQPDGLYVDGRKVILYLSKQQKKGESVKGIDLACEMIGLSVLHPNILDALLEYTNLIPRDWKKGRHGIEPCIFFWAVTFSGGGRGSSCVRCLLHEDAEWRSGFYLLGHDLNSFCENDPAAVVESI